ncbi:MAG: hypothetical protein QF660_03790 [Anaerolineales bacterium]|nr:hypothetical protein [Anaerolineales bacterium]
MIYNMGRGIEIQLLRATTWGLLHFGELRLIGTRLLLTWLAVFCLSTAVSFAITLMAPMTLMK